MKQAFENLKAIHQKGFKLLKIVKLLDRDLLPLSILEAVIATCTPYVALVFTAKLIDLLFSHQFYGAMVCAATLLVTLFVLGMVGSFIRYRTSTSQRVLQTNLEILIRKKSMELEYEIMSDTDLQKGLRNAEDAAKYFGGLGSLVRVYKELLQYGLSALTAVVFIVIFCLAAGKTDLLALQILSNPLVTIGILAATWWMGRRLSNEQAKKIKAIEEDIGKRHYEIENQLSYWQFEVLYDTESGKTIRMNGMQDMILGNVNAFMGKALPLFESMGVSANKRIFAESLESGLFSVAAYLLVLVKVFTHAITIGAFTQYAGALMQLHQALAKVAWSEVEIQRHINGLMPLIDYMERENNKHTGTLPIEKRLDQHYDIEFHNVSFKYPGSDTYILRDVNAKLDPMRKMAVVGPNGAGKTTFIKLLCRLYDPTEGYITLNGIDIRKYDYEEYLSLFSVVFQDFYLFSSSIAENVATGRGFDPTRVERVLKEAGIWTFVEKQKESLETIIENGAEAAIDLSGGQAQKISIARALYKNAPFVILDEPTAALDPISEAEIYERFDEMVEHKTSLYISHRMSSCRFCDEVLVFDKGELVERGPHETLVSKMGLYQKLWSAQAQYYAS